MKKSKNKKKDSKEPALTTARKSKTILKRKQARKDKRQAAKTAKKEYVSKKFRKTKLKDHEDEEIPSDGEEVTGKSGNVKEKVNQNEHEKMKKQMKELKRQQKKQRKKQLLLANEAEEQNIKQLEKNLGLKRRKSKNMPKSFMEDGLDFLLDACDSAKLANMSDEDMEDDFMEQDHEAGGVMEEQDDGESLDSDGDSILDDIFSDNDDAGNEPEEGPGQSEDDAGSESDNDEEEELSESEKEELDNDDLREDIYGRKRDARGNIVKDPVNVEESQTVGKYVPPAMRNKQNLGVSEEKKKALERLSKQLKGLLNRSVFFSTWLIF